MNSRFLGDTLEIYNFSRGDVSFQQKNREGVKFKENDTSKHPSFDLKRGYFLNVNP